MVDALTLNHAISAYGAAGNVATAFPAAAEPQASGFSEMLSGAIENGVASIQKAEQLATAQAMGEKVSLNELVTAIAAAEMTLNTIVTIRDRAITAYQDIVKMPI